MHAHRWLLLICVWSALLASAPGADWPQWRGPRRDGISHEQGLLREWPQEGPKLVWHNADIGDGYSTPAVVGQRIYVLSNRGLEDELVLALDADSGRQLWSTRVGKVGPNRGPQYPGARSTPTVDGERLYALGSDGDLVCLEVADGKLVWHKNVQQQFGGRPGQWAYSESPLLDGDLLVCTPGGSEATLLALHKQSGDVAWKSALPGGDEAGYASAIALDAAGVRQYVQFVQNGLVGVDAKTGRFLWRYAKTAQGSPANIPTPIARDAQVYSGAGRSGGGLVELRTSGTGVEAAQVYFTAKLPTSIGGAVELDGYLFGTNSQGLMWAEFATGDLKWQDRSVGPGAVCYADGRIYLHGENGEVALVEATHEAYREKGRFSPPNQPEHGRSKAWAYPVVANGRLLLRDMGSLWSYDVSQSAAGN